MPPGVDDQRSASMSRSRIRGRVDADDTHLRTAPSNTMIRKTARKSFPARLSDAGRLRRAWVRGLDGQSRYALRCDARSPSHLVRELAQRRHMGIDAMRLVPLARLAAHAARIDGRPRRARRSRARSARWRSGRHARRSPSTAGWGRRHARSRRRRCRSWTRSPADRPARRSPRWTSAALTCSAGSLPCATTPSCARRCESGPSGIAGPMSWISRPLRFAQRKISPSDHS